MVLSSSRDQRPEFMVRLGLAPPYTVEDVKAAYRDQTKRVHPDHGGSAQEFHALSAMASLTYLPPEISH